MSTSTITRTQCLKDLKEIGMSLNAMRMGDKDRLPVEISFEDIVKEKYNMTQAEIFKVLKVNPKLDTLQNVFTMPDQDIRWIVPEIIRNAVTLGMREAPFYPSIIAADESVRGLKVTMPYVNMSDATPSKVNEAETIPLGTISYGQKQASIFKIGKGMKITDEVKNYVSLDVMAIFFRDFGIQLGYAMDTLAMDTVINGNMTDGSESAPVVGVTNPTNGIVYRDLLRLWIRGSRMGRKFTSLIGGEEAAIDMLDLPEFKDRNQGTTQATLNLKTPVPTSADFFIHPGVPDNQVLLLDKSSALIKLTAQQLMLESERIVSNQTEATYASLTTGFSKMYLDAAILMDKTLDFSTNGFPSYMNVDPWLMVGLD